MFEVHLALKADSALRKRQPRQFQALCSPSIDCVSQNGDPSHVNSGDRILIASDRNSRHDAAWERPNEFWRDRFLPEHAKERYPFSYLPFSAGPRSCIGHRFAMIEGPLVLARLLQRFRFSPAPGGTPGYVWSISMRPKGGERLLVDRWA